MGVRDKVSYLITGGAGSIGSNLIRFLRNFGGTQKIIAFDNNEYGLSCLPSDIELAVGDLRDKNRLEEVLNDIDIVVHAGALKRIEMAEWNVKECIKTNVIGTMNLTEACQKSQVKKLLLISSDKAVPTDEFSLYGATKYLQEKIVLTANKGSTLCSIARFGNVMGTRGDVLEIWSEQIAANKPLSITDPDMRRFFWSMESAIDFIADCLDRMEGGEIFVPKMTEYNIMELKVQYFPNAETTHIGIRPGETMSHKLMTPQEEAKAKEYDWGWTIK